MRRCHGFGSFIPSLSHVRYFLSNNIISFVVLRACVALLLWNQRHVLKTSDIVTRYTLSQGPFFNVVSMDKSRMGSLEILQVYQQLRRKLFVPVPIQLRDLSLQQCSAERIHGEADTSLHGPANVQLVGLQTEHRYRASAKKTTKEGRTTRDLALSLGQSLSSTYADFTFGDYVPASPWEEVPITTTLSKDSASGRYFYHDVATGKSWWESYFNLKAFRILIINADLGSDIFKLYCYFAHGLKIRCMSSVDTPHRFSSYLVLCLKTVPATYKAMLRAIIYHRYRRAPYGGGRLFKSCKEAVARLLELPKEVVRNHVLVRRIAARGLIVFSWILPNKK